MQGLYTKSDFERNKQGVKTRFDNRGDSWAVQHREQLGGAFWMQDVDAMFGHLAFGHNTGERLFLEYAADDFSNRLNSIRRFALVAMLDRKSTSEAAFDEKNRVSTAFYLYICRAVGECQPVAPKFFFVIGKDRPPWTMVELDIRTGEQKDEAITLPIADWRSVWAALGLSSMRSELTRWLQGSPSRRVEKPQTLTGAKHAN